MPLTGELHEGAERLGGAQDRNMGGYPGFEARADQQAAALVAVSWSAYLRLSKNARCMGPASSSEASPLMACRPAKDPPIPTSSARRCQPASMKVLA